MTAEKATIGEGVGMSWFNIILSCVELLGYCNVSNSTLSSKLYKLSNLESGFLRHKVRLREVFIE